MSKLEFKNDYRVFFSPENPQLTAYEKFQKIYTKDDNILLVVTHPKYDVFSNEFALALQWLTDEAWKLPFSTRVDSISNYQHSKAEADDLLVGDLMPAGVDFSEDEFNVMRLIAKSEPMLNHRLIGEQSNVSAVNAILTLPGEESVEVIHAAQAARDLKQRFLKAFPEYQMHLTGMVMLNHAFAEASIRDMSTLIPLMYVGMFGFMVWILRTWVGMLAGVLVVAMSTIMGMGLMGWLGIPLTPPSAVAPTIIMTLAIADSVHILVSYMHELRQGRPQIASLVRAMRINFQPVFLTSLTTALGFLSLNFSDAPPFRHLGTVVAMGVGAAWLLSVFMLPAFVSLIPIRKWKSLSKGPSWSDRWAEMMIRNRKAGLAGSVLVVGILACFIPRIELNDQWVEYFAPGLDFRDDTDYAMDQLTGIYTLEYSMESGESGGINNPAYLVELEKFSTWLKEQPGVLQIHSMSDVMKRLNKNMHGDALDWYRLPDERELAAQYLLLFEMSLPYGLDLNNVINVDKSASRVTVTLGNISAGEVRSLIESSNGWIKEHVGKPITAEATSPTVMFSYISERNIRSMLGGTLLAVLLISAILAIALKSFRYGWISLIPNLVPAILGFGVWGLFVGSMGMSLAVVTGMTLGIVVDDTVHFLTKYLLARREQAASAADAVRYAFKTVAPAMVATTLILLIGFFILSFSVFRLNNWMAQLTGIVIALALIADFILLPCLLLAIDKKVAK
jgi:uncharacterized protein